MSEVKAQNSISMTSVKAIKDASDEATTLLDGMRQSAIDAGTTLNGIYQVATDAEASATSAQASADSASEYASRALGNLASVQSVTETLNWITAHGTMTLTSDTALDPSHVYFVVDANGDYVVGGTHYSVVSEPVLANIGSYYELSINESLNNYVATHLAVDTEGLWIIPDSGGNKVLIATGSGSTYTTAGTYIVSGSTVLASFTANGATIGQNVSGQSRTIISSDGMQIYRKVSNSDTQLVNLGYGLGTNASGGQSYAPYTTLGERDSGSAVGNYSVAEGKDTTSSAYGTHAEGVRTTASAYSAHAEGEGTTSSGSSSHAEGQNTTASGDHAHAEGYGTFALNDHSHAEGYLSQAQNNNAHAEGASSIANGLTSHAEGQGTVARGNYAHAQNRGTNANRLSQTVIGEYNADDPNGNATTRGKYAFIIGNGSGTASAERSNALAVLWDGNVEMALDTTAISGTDYEIYTALVSLGWDSDCIV